MGVLHIDRADAPLAATTACAGQHIIALARRLSYATTLEEVMGILKRITRQMFGRAKFDLLRQRVLCTA